MEKGKYIYSLILMLGLAPGIITSCSKDWEEHYENYPQTVDGNIWDELQSDSRFSDFVSIINEAEMDTLFLSDNPYTILAPTNDAIAEYQGLDAFNETTLAYHFCSHFVNTSNINGKRQIQTLTEKFALYEKKGSEVFIDGEKVSEESPLYKNGRIFTMNRVMEPKPNLYEYYEYTNPVFTAYIDSQDTIIIDAEKSIPLGFDEYGNTVFDTVSEIGNKFEMEYFPIKHEFRTLSGTVVFPQEEDYQQALNIMAEALGGDYNDYTDIPLDWQEKTLIPHLLIHGVFLNRIEPEEFEWRTPTDTLKLMNILGDSVQITYVPIDQSLCSNGYAYNYEEFIIPDSLYQGDIKMEAEDLLYSTGLNKYAWEEGVTVNSDIALSPLQELIPEASNDSVVRVLFPPQYEGAFSVEFNSPTLFPRRYILEIGTHMDFGGIYDIYVNDELVETFDYYDYILGRGVIRSVTGDRFKPRGRFNAFDMWVDNILEYGKARIRIEYTGPSFVANNGFVVDYFKFTPAPE